MANDLGGRWEGYYEQHGRRHPIALELAQEGKRLRGTMHDGETVTEKSVFETAVEAGLPPGADEQIIQALREQFPDTHGQPVRARSELPALSSVEGHVEGGAVYFLKTYRGECFLGYHV